MPSRDDQSQLKHVEVTVKTRCFYECFVLFWWYIIQLFSASVQL